MVAGGARNTEAIAAAVNIGNVQSVQYARTTVQQVPAATAPKGSDYDASKSGGSSSPTVSVLMRQDNVATAYNVINGVSGGCFGRGSWDGFQSMHGLLCDRQRLCTAGNGTALHSQPLWLAVPTHNPLQPPRALLQPPLQPPRTPRSNHLSPQPPNRVQATPRPVLSL